MAHKMVRQPSETPNINNIDDIIPFRYAYGNQDGYVINKGTELSYTINGNEFRINSGRVVLQGIEDDIDANGVTVTIDNISGVRYYVVYYRVNLATNTTSYEITYDTAGYPIIDKGDDLTKHSSGSANLPLYRFKASSGVISNVEKVAKAIEYSGTALVGYNIDKGTVEERLTRLGFKEDNITDSRGNVVVNFKRQGNYVIGVFYGYINGSWTYLQSLDGTQIPKNFRPKEMITIAETSVISTGNQYISSIGTSAYIDTNGVIHVSATGTGYVPIRELHFGYEANPIE